MRFAERARRRIETRFASGGAAGITASFGVGEFIAEMPMPRSLVEAADTAMYASKHTGRNRGDAQREAAAPAGPSGCPFRRTPSRRRLSGRDLRRSESSTLARCHSSSRDALTNYSKSV